MDFHPLGIWIVGALVNGAVTFGVVKATLSFLNEGVREAKASAARAHVRIDDMLKARAH